MNKEFLLDALGFVDDELVEKHIEMRENLCGRVPKNKMSALKKLAVIAACAAFIVAVCVCVPFISNVTGPEDPAIYLPGEINTESDVGSDEYFTEAPTEEETGDKNIVEEVSDLGGLEMMEWFFPVAYNVASPALETNGDVPVRIYYGTDKELIDGDLDIYIRNCGVYGHTIETRFLKTVTKEEMLEGDYSVTQIDMVETERGPKLIFDIHHSEIIEIPIEWFNYPCGMISIEFIGRNRVVRSDGGRFWAKKDISFFYRNENGVIRFYSYVDYKRDFLGTIKDSN